MGVGLKFGDPRHGGAHDVAVEHEPRGRRHHAGDGEGHRPDAAEGRAANAQIADEELDEDVDAACGIEPLL